MAWRKRFLVGAFLCIVVIVLMIVSMATNDWQVSDSPVYQRWGLQGVCLGLQQSQCVFVTFDQGSTMQQVCSATLAFLILGTIATFFALVWWVLKSRSSGGLDVLLEHRAKRPIKVAMFGCPLWAFILVLVGCIIYAAAAPRASFAALGASFYIAIVVVPLLLVGVLLTVLIPLLRSCLC
jgi:hypothetical protein